MVEVQETQNERIVGVIKNLRGRDIPSEIREEMGINEDDYVNRVFKENSPRSKGYEKSCGRFLDLVKSL